MSNKAKTRISVVFIGHVDSGKSTTTGHLIVLCGGVDKRTMEKMEKEAIDRGKPSFRFAFLFDKTDKERESGITIDITQLFINTPNRHITVIDAPGHRNFIKNMITGSSIADVSVLVLPATKGEFETAIGSDGSAKEHVTLSFTMGVKLILIAVNKMDADSVQYSKQRYDECVSAAISMVSKVGFKKESIATIPISGLEGDNLVEASTKMPWYTGWSYQIATPGKEPVTIRGKTILDWLDQLIPPPRPTDKPLRIVLDSAFKISGIGTVAAGRVESGTLKVGETVVECPAGFTAEVKSIESHHVGLDRADPGDSVGVNLKNIARTEIHRGDVLGHVNNDPPKQTETFTIQTVIIAASGSKDIAFHKGFCPICDCHTAHFPARVEEIECKMDKRTGKVIPDLEESDLTSLKLGETGMVRLRPNQDICVEKFVDYPAMGRVACRDGHTTIAVGVIRKVEKLENQSRGNRVAKPAGGKGGAAKAGGAKAGGAKAGGAKGKK